MNDNKVMIHDTSLRDGNHSVSHQLSQESFAKYCKVADAAGTQFVEVGHGNGLGASSMLVGECSLSDEIILTTARENLRSSKLVVHAIPGFCTIKKDLKLALDIGVDVFRIAAHCTEADITQRHIEYLREQNKEVFGVLMMSHMTSAEILLQEAQKMSAYGAEAVIIMDSAGNYLPGDVTKRISTLVNSLEIAVGFHAHNNLGMAVANSVAAIEAGAYIVDASARGFGAGAGNAHLEALVAVLNVMNYNTGIDLYKLLDAGDIAEKNMIKKLPYINSSSIVSGLAGVFSGFMHHVDHSATKFGIDARDIYFELGKRKVVAGQESLILEIAQSLSEEKFKNNDE